MLKPNFRKKISAFLLSLGLTVSATQKQGASLDNTAAVIAAVCICMVPLELITGLATRMYTKDQRELDQNMAAYFGNASINYKSGWKSISKKMDGFISSSIHNKEEIRKIMAWTKGFYNSWYGIFNEKLERSGYLPACLMVSISGPSGCGMHQFVRTLGNALGASNIITIKPSDFDVVDSRTWSVYDQAIGNYMHTSFQTSGFKAQGRLVELFSRNRKAFVIVEDFDRLPEIVRATLYNARNSGKLVTKDQIIDIRGSMFFLLQNELNENSFILNKGIRSISFNKPNQKVYLLVIRDMLSKLVSKYPNVQIIYTPTAEHKSLDTALATFYYNRGANINDLSYVAFDLDSLISNAVASGRKTIDIGIDYNAGTCIEKLNP